MYFLHILNHGVVTQVGKIGDLVEQPECGGGRVGHKVAVANLEAVRHLGAAAENGHVACAVGVVHSEPEDSADRVGKTAPALGNKGESCLLCGGGSLMNVFFSFVAPGHGTPAVWAGEGAGSDILGHVKGGAFEMVAHE